ncbi:hypothetical protein MZD04_gp216 [Pseudomonas phage Psa21]|uniref:Uncharacterized protein n=1 Tax=Pseudomonas phage Psa21 TaxID=2530023 RepID=A0A481W4Y9_9CAUD|nr:hypothetical protein MZD04_gp216 [Pseudomonas phage Psa21]QBJ02742.1 hypothetical protein PSA21_216 [Pseudomonas phage Psa21]
MASVIPQIGIKGRWEVKDPFSVQPGLLYTLGAIRSFVDIENNGVNVFDTYYGPVGIPQATYSDDRRKGVMLLTLLSDTVAPIYIPSSFVTAYPSLDSVNYHHVVLSASCGALPVTMSLDFLVSQVAKIVSDTIGVTPTINIGVVPLLSVVTPEQHETNEAKREAAIANRTTDYARLAEEQRKNALLSQRLAVAETIIKNLKDQGLIP